MDATTLVTNFRRVQQAFHLIAVSFMLTSYMFPEQAVVHDLQEYDYIIVGGGTAGSVVANRLSECGNHNVLLIDAGGDPPDEVLLPGFFPFLTQSHVDWQYTAYNENSKLNLTRTRSPVPAGKVLGGGSSINYMLYVRGCPGDFDSWADAAGDSTWNWQGVYPYFIKTERLEAKNILKSSYRSYHGTSGYLGVSGTWNKDLSYLVDSFKYAGHPTVLDINGEQQLGYTEQLCTVAGGVRQTTAYTILAQIKNRPNFHLLKNSFVTKILFDSSNKVYGVRVITNDNKKLILQAKREVILSAGAIRSPQLLMLSGIGPRQHLESFGIKVRSDLAVGELQDHPSVIISIKMDKSNATQELFNPHKYPLSIVTGYVALDKSRQCPDYQSFTAVVPDDPTASFYLCSFGYGLDYDICHDLYRGTLNKASLFSVVNLLHPQSRGRVSLNSIDARDYPLINAGYFSDVRDFEKLVASAMNYIEVLDSPYFRSVNAELVDFETCKCSHLYGVEYWRCYVLCTVSTMYHYSGTCAMGKVVDSRLRVKGVTGLRVVDASAMPYLTSGNINAPVIVLAEKAAEFIIEDSLDICVNERVWYNNIWKQLNSFS